MPLPDSVSVTSCCQHQDAARKLGELENPDKPGPKKIAALETAIRNAAYILEEIDRKWPDKAPFAN